MPHINTGFSRVLASCTMMTLLAFLAPSAFAAATLQLESPVALPKLSFKDSAGKKHGFGEGKAKLTAIHLWAIWCAPCIGELPQVDEAQAAYGDKGFKVIPISVDADNNMEKSAEFLKSHNLTHLTTYFDDNSTSFQALHARGLPVTIFVNADGKEIARSEGPLDWKSSEVSQLIEQALK